MNRVISTVIIIVSSILLAGQVSAGSYNKDYGKKAYKKMEKKMNIVDIASSKSQFSTLVAAVKAAGLADTLKGDGPFTVFAPTNAAFDNLPEGTVASLLKPENKDQLVSILTYHVVPGKVLAEDVVKLTGAKTVQGQSVKIKVHGGEVKIDGAKVVSTDIKAANGVIHVIDAVVLPRDELSSTN